ncbi:ABC transporter substrate-binding protein [Limoniibacter endophyticus]|uniref:Iron ABC transporter n=1 Tax=Limoniibacter endophyticus TaxID=1565040 RepID=A0A8J3GHB2_9HYPH|nr:ABC transporter substrate-binding protein [Limoniibacter endophyticus]GHC77808.1 iron ABC transporter [Limoniibacter endophyticus]
MRPLLLLSLLLLCAGGVQAASETYYPALSSDKNTPVVRVYSALDEPIARPLILGFQKANPDVAVHYFEMLTPEVYSRIVEETDRGRKTADFAFSSAMDLQVKLVNDGYVQRADLPLSSIWPEWAHWRHSAYALTFEPAVFVYHKPSFLNQRPPSTRAEFLSYLESNGKSVFGKIGTYDIERAGVGFLFLSRDEEQFEDIWSVIRAMGAAGVRLHSTSSAILERVANGRFVLGYNILGSYATHWAKQQPNIGIVLPKDYTVVMSRIGLVPAQAASPELGKRYLSYFMSKEGQTILSQELGLPAVSPEISGENTANTMQRTFGAQLRPVPVTPGLMVYLDQMRRAKLIERWNETLRNQR